MLESVACRLVWAQSETVDGISCRVGETFGFLRSVAVSLTNISIFVVVCVILVILFDLCYLFSFVLLTFFLIRIPSNFIKLFLIPILLFPFPFSYSLIYLIRLTPQYYISLPS